LERLAATSANVANARRGLDGFEQTSARAGKARARAREEVRIRHLESVAGICKR